MPSSTAPPIQHAYNVWATEPVPDPATGQLRYDCWQLFGQYRNNSRARARQAALVHARRLQQQAPRAHIAVRPAGRMPAPVAMQDR
jgi:hypothetical protein